MNKTEQRIAIAEACGWINQGKAKKVPALEHRWKHPTLPYITDQLPDYCTDLNACHEMEKVLEAHHRMYDKEKYLSELWNVCGNEYEVIHATAAQRAEAFLKALNLWKE